MVLLLYKVKSTRELQPLDCYLSESSELEEAVVIYALSIISTIGLAVAVELATCRTKILAS